MVSPTLSIVMISKNEEKYLPVLLESIKQQGFLDYELILSDAGSTDKTRSIAKKYGCRIVTGGLPSKGRNAGARFAKGKYILFLDSDIYLPNNFLKALVDFVENKSLGSASMWCKPDSKKIIDRFVFFLSNIFIKSMERFTPRTSFGCMLARRDVFQKTKGFNEDLLVGEDNDFMKRTEKFGKFRVFTGLKLTASVRRFEKEGRFKYFSKMLKVIIYDFIGKKVTAKSKIKYDFSGKY